MSLSRMTCLVVALIAIAFTVGTVYAQQNTHKADLSKAQATVNNITQAQPPQVSTTTKPSPVGQPVSDYKPTVHIKPAPPPPPPTLPAPKKK